MPYPAMLPEVETLLRVQHHDQKIRSIDKELAGIPLEAEDIQQRLQDEQKALESPSRTSSWMSTPDGAPSAS